MGLLDVTGAGRCLLAICVALAGCADLPDLDETVPPALEDANYPALAPVDQVLGRSATEAANDEETADQLEARSAGLQARADTLQRRSAIDSETRRRLEDGVDADL